MESNKDIPESGTRITLRVTGGVLVRNTAINLVGRVLPLVVAVVAMPYTVHHLGADRFGILSLAWVVTGYFALFDLGIGAAVTKFVAEFLGKGEADRLPGLIWTALTSQLSLGVLAGILLAGATPILVGRALKIPVEVQPQAYLVFLILSFSLPISFAASSLGGVLAASQRFDLVNAVGVPSSALNYLLPVVALAMGFGLPVIVLFLVLARLASLAVTYYLCTLLYPTLSAGFRFHWSHVKALLGFGGWVTVSGVVTPILIYFDRFLIGAVMSIAAVGFYTPPALISNKLLILPTSLTATLFPALSASAGRGDVTWIRNAFVRSLKFLLLITGPVVLMMVFFARRILILWLGVHFATAGALALQILAIGALIHSLAHVPSSILQGLGRPDLTAKFHMLEVPLHVGLAWFLITRFGLPGAALAWTIRASLNFLLLLGGACWVTRTSPRLLASKELRRSVGILAAMALCLTAIWFSTQTLIFGVVFTLVLGGGFLIAAWHYILDLEEKWQIKLWLGIAR